MLASHPYQCAAAFPAVANFLWTGGRLVDHQVLKPIGTASSFKMVRACVGSDNAHGIALLCKFALRADARSANGSSLLDLALDSKRHQCGQAALMGLGKNSRLAGTPGGMASLVQASFGKLVERHPELIPLALEYGARADRTVLAAWEALHPIRRAPGLEAAINAALMNNVIDGSFAAPDPLSTNPAPKVTTRLHRRAGGI